MRAPSDIPRRLSLANRRTRWALVIAVVALIVLFAMAQRLAQFYTDYLWFRSVNFSSVWAKTITVQIGLGATFTVAFFALLFGNLWLADRLAPAGATLAPPDELVSRWQEISSGRTHWVRLALAASFALIGGLSAHSQWGNWLLFSNAQPFSSATAPWNGLDPLNHWNDSFYVFKLPFLNWLVGWAFSALVVTLLLCLVEHYLNGGIRPHSSMQRVSRQVKAHLSVLLAALALVEGANYYLQRLALVLSTKYPILDGATYTDVHASRPALLLLIAISVIAAGLFLYNVRQQGWLLPAVAVALWFLVWVIVANIYPAIIQDLVVKPAESTKEAPYLTENIKATTWGYGLQNVQTHRFQGNSLITPSEISGKAPDAVVNRQTLSNVPLLDVDVSGMNSVFNKEQGFWGYYTMSGPSTDRYDLPTGTDGKNSETQVLISARQLNSGGAPSSWVNQSLVYTHGYGAVVTPVNQSGIQSGGTPNYTLQGLPPSGTPTISQPRIYFDNSSGAASSYVIAGSDQPELDYEAPTTFAEKTTHYSGTGGVAMGGFLRRLAYAVSFSSPNIILSSDIESSSRILYYRNVVQRLEKVAPFLAYDSDPYPVITNGSLYWVVDAYTTSNNFPYSEQAGASADFSRLPGPSYGSDSLSELSFNYVRNSVKAVVDAYTGQMWFFVMNQPDPIIATYEQAFPQLFTPVDDAEKDIPGITAHWRYPEDIFTVQTNMYSIYHQTNTTVFYQNSQAWAIAQNPAAGGVTAATTTVPGPLGVPAVSPPPPDVMPEYELLALPGDPNQSFVLMQPFQPASSSGQKQNLTAFMTASSDPSDYGNLDVYTIPGGTSVEGPYQVTSAIEQKPSISSELTLLGQKGSRVVLGDVMLTPIGQSLIYTEPLYVEQESNQLPRLADVIVVYGSSAFDSGTSTNDPTLAAALCQVTNPDGSHPFASYCAHAPSTTTTTTVPSRGHHPPTTTSTTTTVPPATTTTVPSTPGTARSAAQDLAIAEQYFADANRALKEEDLATYQNDIRAAEAEVGLALESLEAHKATTTSLPAKSGTKSSTTTSAPTKTTTTPASTTATQTTTTTTATTTTATSG
ncbi:MAG TPA: UPF0182 family protein [Acidimicrobiales bacterium]|nr:UPF0182 family protein [Acidimicrobiales bacterium]